MSKSETSASGVVRVEPQQARSRATLGRIEAAGREVLHTVGRDRFATSDVASRAGVSIGTLYRYFADRTELLDHLWPDRRDTFLPD